MDRISVVVPFKNEEKYLGDCIRSMGEQRTSSFSIEILLIDDHSTDSSFSLVSSLIKRYANMRLVANEGSGIVDALNTGYRMSQGNFIHRMDADDIMPKDKLKNLYECLVSNPQAQITTGYVSYFSSDKELNEGYKSYEKWLNSLVDNASFFSEIYKECPIASPNWLIHREAFEKAGAFQCDYPEDYELVFKWKKQNFQVASCKQITHLWRDHSSRVSRNSEHYSDNSFIHTKVNGYIACDNNVNEKLVVVGAGKKGKKIALAFNQKQITFTWLTSNENKIGHIIYDQKLKDLETLKNIKTAHVIIGFSNPEELKEMKKFSEKDDSNIYFWFF